jgi:Na+-driven multidrug efflux pump
MSRETAEKKENTGEEESKESRDQKRQTGVHSPQKATEGVGILLGDPEKAVIKLSIPIIVAMAVQTIYSLTDTFWVAGLGADALAAVGFAFPFFVIQMRLQAGWGRRRAAISEIGARDKAGADNVAVHTFVIMLVLTVVLT